jgi:hypothetical protein
MKRWPLFIDRPVACPVKKQIMNSQGEKDNWQKE